MVDNEVLGLGVMDEGMVKEVLGRYAGVESKLQDERVWRDTSFVNRIGSSVEEA